MTLATLLSWLIRAPIDALGVVGEIVGRGLCVAATLAVEWGR